MYDVYEHVKSVARQRRRRRRSVFTKDRLAIISLALQEELSGAPAPVATTKLKAACTIFETVFFLRNQSMATS